MVIGIDCSRAFGVDRTGTENYSYHIISHMVRLPTTARHKLVLFTRPNVAIPDWLGMRPVEVVTIGRDRLWTQLGLAKATWETKLDVLWVPAHTLPIWRKPGLKTVVTIHGLEYRWLPEYQNWLQRWYLPLSTFYAAKSADKIIAVSKFTAAQLKDELDIPEAKIKVIYEGVSAVDEKQPGELPGKVGAKLSLKHGLVGKSYLLFVGTIQPRKNLASLVMAFAQIADEYRELQLVIVGARGWLADADFRAVKVTGIADRVVFAGRVSDLELAWMYQHAVIYVQPSWQEGFGLPVLEAMKWGTPVVTSDGGALKEVAGEAAVVVPHGKDFVSRFAKAMKQLLSDKGRRQQLASAGKRRAAAWTWERTAKMVLQELVS